jgi:hypothetical protein
LTGDFEFILHKHRDLGGTVLEGLSHPMLETEHAWHHPKERLQVRLMSEERHPGTLNDCRRLWIPQMSQGLYMVVWGDAFPEDAPVLMTVNGLTEDEAIPLMSAAVDFGMTQ